MKRHTQRHNKEKLLGERIGEAIPYSPRDDFQEDFQLTEVSEQRPRPRHWQLPDVTNGGKGKGDGSTGQLRKSSRGNEKAELHMRTVTPKWEQDKELFFIRLNFSHFHARDDGFIRD